jgi:hypothetical protein
MQLMQDLKTSLYKSMYPGDAVISDAELRSFSDLVLDLARRLTAPVSKKGGPS